MTVSTQTPWSRCHPNGFSMVTTKSTAHRLPQGRSRKVRHKCHSYCHGAAGDVRGQKRCRGTKSSPGCLTRWSGTAACRRCRMRNSARHPSDHKTPLATTRKPDLLRGSRSPLATSFYVDRHRTTNPLHGRINCTFTSSCLNLAVWRNFFS